jgi:cytochrome c553
MEAITMKALKVFGLGCASALMSLGATTYANEISAERVYHMSLAATCANCHGTNGVSVAGQDMPKIDELTHEQIATTLRQYKSGEKSGTIMPQIAKGYTEEQIDIIAQVLGHN